MYVGIVVIGDYRKVLVKIMDGCISQILILSVILGFYQSKFLPISQIRHFISQSWHSIGQSRDSISQIVFL
ncbi:hypothetical protein SAMN05877753_10419 [Bacillus oleivorans]|uniref:Uncharacterized protein n=1 Tax=Bacillus oleivorans TaxID=1448271 RepID=A0A285CRW1_9BACI|nr:hypothetical protein SAMN05877753_10419 [Bacillus oleivorans]